MYDWQWSRSMPSIPLGPLHNGTHGKLCNCQCYNLLEGETSEQRNRELTLLSPIMIVSEQKQNGKWVNPTLSSLSTAFRI